MKNRILVELIIEGDPSQAHAAVGRALDLGLLQDEINDPVATEESGKLKVISAVVCRDEGLSSDRDPDDDIERPACPACGGETYRLGGLGKLTHFRCRACGADCSRPVNS